MAHNEEEWAPIVNKGRVRKALQGQGLSKDGHTLFVVRIKE